MVSQLDLFPPTYEDLRESVAAVRDEQARINRALFAKLHELEEENRMLVAQIWDINSVIIKLDEPTEMVH